MTANPTPGALYQRARRARLRAAPPLQPLAELIERRPGLAELATVGARIVAAAMEGA